MAALLQKTHMVVIGIYKNICVHKSMCAKVLESLSVLCAVVSTAIQ